MLFVVGSLLFPLCAAHCKCFDACTEHDFANFSLRLPVARPTDTSSPWAAYFAAVYGDASFPEEVNLRHFEMFYVSLPESPPIHACSWWNVPRAPQCDQTECARWLDPDAVVSAEAVATRARTGALLAAGRRDDLDFVGLQHRYQDRVAYTDNEWAEVMHKGIGAACEGFEYGRWFYATRGSGVFVNVGHTAAFATSHALERQWRPRHDNICGDVKRRPAGIEVCCSALDRFYADAAREHGYDSFQRVRSHGWTIASYWNNKSTNEAFEVVVVDGSTEPSPGGGCVRSAALRTGWFANSACHCDPHKDKINCRGVARPSPPPALVSPLTPPPVWPPVHHAAAISAFEFGMTAAGTSAVLLLVALVVLLFKRKTSDVHRTLHEVEVTEQSTTGEAARATA